MTAPDPELRLRAARLARILVPASLAGGLLLFWSGEPSMTLFLSLVTALAKGLVPGIAVSVAAAFLGLAVFPVRAWRACTRTEVLLFAFGGGAVLLSCAVLLAGWFGTLTPGGVGALLAAACLAGFACLAVSRNELIEFGRGRARALSAADRQSLHPAWPVLVFVTALPVVLTAWAPPLLYDVTEYHLGALGDYRAAAGLAGDGSAARFVPVPHNMYARFPFPVESLYFAGTLLGGPLDTAPKVLNAAFTLAGALLVASWLRRRTAMRWSPWLGAALFLGHPLVAEVSLDAYIDAPTAFLLVAGVLATLTAAGRADETGVAAPRLFPVAGLLLGGAFAAKYTTAQLYLLPVLACVAPAVVGVRRMGALEAGARGETRDPRSGDRPGAPVLLAAVLLGLLPAALWLGKNVAWYGNPLEPFFVKWFRPGDSAAIAREQYYIAAHFPQSILSGVYWSRLPLRLGALGWHVVAPLAGILLIAHRRSTWRLCAFVAISVLLWNLIGESQNRFLLASAMLALVLAVEVVAEMESRWLRRAAIVALALAAVSVSAQYGLKLLYGGVIRYAADFDPVRAARFAADPERLRAGFLEQNLGAIGEVANFANETLPRDARVLLVYEARPYLLRARAAYNTVFDSSELLRLAKGARGGAEVAARLRAAGCTHVLVNREELRRFLEQYATRELAKAGVEADAIRREFPRLPDPESLYPPFALADDWPALRAPVMEFFRDSRTRAIKAAGRPEAEVWLAPIP